MMNHTAEPSAEYLKALDASRIASKKFSVVTAAYRARKIGDAEYLAARREHDAAMEAFDLAYAKESR